MNDIESTEQEKFNDMLEDYIDSAEGRDSFRDLFADFLKTPEGIAAVRAATQHDDSSLSSAHTLIGGTTTTQAPGSTHATPAKPPAVAVAPTVATLPDEEMSKYDLVDTLDHKASKQWVYTSPDTIHGRSSKRVVSRTTAHIRVELGRWLMKALRALGLSAWEDLDQEHYAHTRLLHILVTRMRCKSRFRAGLILLDEIVHAFPTKDKAVSAQDDYRRREFRDKAASA